ncbi:MAG: FlgD Ig-like domain [Chloroflexi bacterium]|nr:FlgD Ig-like domain [Chloroflexota bacterium]
MHSKRRQDGVSRAVAGADRWLPRVGDPAGARSGSTGGVTASLVKMPAGSPATANDHVLYLFWDGLSTSAMSVSVEIKNSQNVVVRTISASQTPGPQSVVWDGKDGSGTVGSPCSATTACGSTCTARVAWRIRWGSRAGRRNTPQRPSPRRTKPLPWSPQVASFLRRREGIPRQQFWGYNQSRVRWPAATKLWHDLGRNTGS